MLKLFLADIKMMLRNRQAFFWMLMFPLMFTFIFGFFFGKSTTVGTIAVINQSQTELSQKVEQSIKDSGLFTISNEKDTETAKSQIKKNKLSNVVVIPESFGTPAPDSAKKIVVYFDPGNNQVNTTLTGFLDQVLTGVNYSVQNAKPIYTVDQENVGSNNTLSYFDFVLAGILGLALMNSSIMGISISMTKYRQDQILKRITTTPVKTWWFIFGEVASRLMLNVLQISIILLVGKYIFDAHIYGNIFIIYCVAILGALLFQLVGFSIASFAKTTEAAEGMATAITIPMMFLGGVFFPIDSLPKWLYSAVQFMPLAPLLRIMRGVILEGNSPFVNPINITLLLSWILVCALIAIFRFRLTEE